MPQPTGEKHMMIYRNVSYNDTKSLVGLPSLPPINACHAPAYSWLSHLFKPFVSRKSLIDH
jgi:hypothetical protein